MRLFDLSGRAALVTGGNGGIGLGMAQGLAEAGARVLITGRDAAKGAAALERLGPGASFLASDIAADGEAARLVAQAEARFGRLDILVNNAGTSIRKRPEDYDPAEWEAVLAVNLTAVFRLCQAAHPALVRAGGGKIINIASLNAWLGAPHNVPYATSKGGVLQMTRGLATAWAADRIQVNAVLPGFIDTDMTAAARAHVPGLGDAVMQRTPAGRWGVPEDLAGVAVFLASPASDFVTGAAIPVDGGYSIRA